MAYVDIAYVKLVGSMPAADIDAVEALYPGTFEGLAESVCRTFDARLQKRYATPFLAPYPEALRFAVAQVLVYLLFMKRGFNPSSEQDGLVQSNRDEALTWLKEAADSKEGLVELPLREDLKATEGITRGGPLVYHEASPYKWTDTQRDDGRTEDYE